MCCRTSVFPLEIKIAAAILSIGQFHPKTDAQLFNSVPTSWQRLIPEEGYIVTVTLDKNNFDLTISPSISTYDHHLGKRITASVYFEIASKYAEKVGGEIIQRATVVGCKDTDSAGLLVARYPSMPMSFDRVCLGFQDVLIGGAHKEPPLPSEL